MRQVGTPFKAGFNVRMGSDNTLYSVGEGKVMFRGRDVARRSDGCKGRMPCVAQELILGADSA